jgi:hypothetical protein
MNVTAVTNGAIVVGMVLSGTGITSGTTVVGYGTGSGGTGTYTVSASQIVISTTISANLPPNKAVVWNGSTFVWGTAGGSGGVANENVQILTSNYTMTAGNNGESVGPITIVSGVTATIPAGSRWLIL